MQGSALLLSTALLAAAVPAHAQPDGGGEFSTKEIRAVTHDYAKCVVKREPRRAAEAIRLNVSNSTMLKDYPSLFVPDCLTGGPGQSLQARFGGDLYRYALADALVSRDLKAFEPKDFAAVPRLDHRDPGKPPAQVDAKGKKLSQKKYDEALAAHEKLRAFAYLSQYGECVVRVAPAESKALLLAKPDSADEATRFRALMPAFSTCLPEGQSLKFGKVPLRGTIAVNYYRLAMAAKSAATGTAG